MRRRPLALFALVLTATVVAAPGCGRSDKAGGVTAPLVLRLASADPVDDAFAAEVRELSHGRMRVEVTHYAAGHATADYQVRAAKLVVSGRFDLGTVAAEAWSKLGVRSFEPFELPFLVSDQSTLKAVLQSPVPAQMLKGLSARNVVGLALTPGLLRHPIGYSGPVTTPADFRGKGMHVPVSGVGDDLAAILGATPVHLPPGPSAQRTRLLRSHRLEVDEDHFLGPPDAWFTANETLAAGVSTIVANGKSYGRLSPEQRRILRTAAANAASDPSGLVFTKLSEARIAVDHCDVARVLNASPTDVAALERATRPLYAQLASDPHLRPLIAAIQAIKARTPPDPSPKVPASCSRPIAPTRGPARSSSLLNGTYRWRLDGQTMTMTLLGGRWRISESGDHGTYKILGDRIALYNAFARTTVTFTFKRRPDGTLDLRPVLPMNRGDIHVLSSQPWKRIGPAVASVR